jgi:HAD superfamily hydrolase (TIGR01490 family)
MHTIAFFDVDGTLTTERVWRGLLEYFRRRGERRWTHLFFWAFHLPLFFLFKTGMISQSAFRRPWAAHLAWFLRGYTVAEAEPIWDWVTKEYLTPYWRSDALELIESHKQAGDLVVLVSAGPTPLEQAIADHLGADFAVGTDFEIEDGIYTGRANGVICIDENKAHLTRAALQRRGLSVDWEASHAYADSAGDVHLLGMVGNPVAFHPDDQLGPIAKVRGWKSVIDG